MSGDPFDDLDEALPKRELMPHEVDRLVERVQAGIAGARPRRVRVPVATLALAAAALVAVGLTVWWAVTPDVSVAPPERPELVQEDPLEVSPGDTDLDDRVWATAGTRYTLEGPADDRVVRLEAGRVRCDVETRDDGGRFRVIVGGAEVEVTGTRFEVTADGEALQMVSVEEGEVVVRLDDGRTHRLAAGESWSRAVRAAPRVEDDGEPPTEDDDEPEAAPPVSPFTAGLAHYDAGDWAAARDLFGRVTDGPLAADARFWKAITRVRLVRDDGAVRAVESALVAGVPAEREGALRCVLGRLLQDLDRADEAAPHLAWAAADADPAVAACGASSR